MRTSSARRRGPRSARGVTAVELLMVLLIVTVLAIAAGPSLASVIVAQRLRAAGTDLVSALLLARSEAIKRNASVRVRPAAGDDWTSGWVSTTADGEQIDRRTPPGSRVRVTRAPDAVVYGPTGRLDGGGRTRFEFVDAQGQAGVSPRCVTIDIAGLPRLEAQSCS